jgi:hypothetical protein
MKKKIDKNKVRKDIDETKDPKFSWLSVLEARTLAGGGYFDEEGLLHNKEGAVRCTSVVRSTGKRCKNFAGQGEVFCKYHGGSSAEKTSGKNRIYSPFIQDTRIEAIYRNTVDAENKELSGIKDELGLLRALLAKVVGETENLGTKGLKEVAGVIGEIRQLVMDCVKAEVRFGNLISLQDTISFVTEILKINKDFIDDEELRKRLEYEYRETRLGCLLSNMPKPSAELPVREIPINAGALCPGHIESEEAD